MNLFKSLGGIALAAAIVSVFVGVFSLIFPFGAVVPGWAISPWFAIGLGLGAVSLVFFLLGFLIDKFSEWQMKRGIRKRRSEVGKFTKWD